MLVKKIYYCPVKSLSFNEVTNIQINPKNGIINDRIIAFTRGLNNKSSSAFNNSNDRNLNYFLTLRNTPYLKKYNFIYNDKKKYIKLYLKNKKIIEGCVNNPKDVIKIEKFIENINVKIKKPIYLIYNDKFPFFDTTPAVSVSMINLNTIKELELKLKKKIEYERFRGNILIDNLNAWEEFNLIKKTLIIGNVKFKVDSKIPRCSATNINPNNYDLDINLPNNLIELYGHKYFGIYLIPLSSGSIKRNDKIKIV